MVAGLRSSSGASFRVLQLLPGRRLQTLATTALFLEYEAVLCRRHQRAATELSQAQVRSLLSAFAIFCEPVEIRFAWRPQLFDPNDEFVLEAAINGRADAIVTHNVRDFAAPARRFGVGTLSPSDLLKEVEK